MFDTNDRDKEVILINTSNETRTYRLSWEDKRQLANGNYEDEVQNYPYSAAPHLRFSPRQVKLAAGERQVIKILKRNVNALDRGDYRSHLNFTVLPRESGASQETQSGISIRLESLINYSIPVIFKVGNDSSRAQIEAVTWETKDALSVNISKNGLSSIFGRLEIWGTINGQDKRLDYLNGVNIFRESTLMTFDLNIPKDVMDSQPRNIRVVYLDVITNQTQSEIFVKNN